MSVLHTVMHALFHAEPLVSVWRVQEQGSLANAMTRKDVANPGPVKAAHDGFESKATLSSAALARAISTSSEAGSGMNVARHKGKEQWLEALRQERLLPPLAPRERNASVTRRESSLQDPQQQQQQQVFR